MQDFLLRLGYFLTFTIASFILLYLGKVAYHLFHPKIDVEDELVEKDNLAFAISYAGYFAGLIIAIGGSISGPEHGFVADLKDIAFFGVLSILLLNLSLIVNSKVLFSKFSIYQEILRDRNPGAAAVQAASSIATGLIIFSVISTPGNGGKEFWFELAVTLGFWLLGQSAIIIIAYIYNLITPYDIFKEIEKDNIAVGVGFAGMIIAISIVICRALSQKYTHWENLLYFAGFELLVGMVFLPFMRYLVGKVLMPSRSLTDEIVNQEVPNVGAAILEAMAYIGGALIIGWAI